MRPRAWCPATLKFSAPASIFPIPTGPTRSTRAARSRPKYSFDVLHLFAQFFDLRPDFQGETGDGQSLAFHAGSLRQHGVGFAMHLLEKKIQFLTQLSGAVQEFRELLHVTPQAVQFFADIAALRKQGGFLRKPSRLDPGAVEEFLEPRLQAPRKSGRQGDRKFAHFFRLLA